MTLPPNVGFPVGGSGGVQYGVLQFHYDNPSQSNSFVDSSGVRLHIRPRSGEDAGFMFVGVDNGYIRIPKGESKWHIMGDCPSSATTKFTNSLHIFGYQGIDII